MGQKLTVDKTPKIKGFTFHISGIFSFTLEKAEVIETQKTPEHF